MRGYLGNAFRKTFMVMSGGCITTLWLQILGDPIDVVGYSGIDSRFACAAHFRSEADDPRLEENFRRGVFHEERPS